MKGIFKFYKADGGYGFITGDDAEDYFVHVKDIKNVLPNKIVEKGQHAEFEPQRTEKGLCGKNVRLTD